VDLAIRNGNVLNMQGEVGPRASGSGGAILAQWTIGVTGDRITWMGPDDEFDGNPAATIDATGKLVTPGFVDPHTHLVYGGDRAFEMALKLEGKSYMEILAAGGGISHTRKQTLALDADGLARQARPRLERMIAAGTTTLESKSGYAFTTEGELTMLDASLRLESVGAKMAHTFLGAHAVPAEYAGRTDAYVELIVDEMLPAVARQGIARYCDVFVEKDVFTVEQGRRVLEAASEQGFATRLHADEIVNTGGAELAADTGVVTADHLLRISQAGIDAMASAGTMATLMPTVPLTLMRPEWAPGRQIMDAGIPVALATDHNPNNPVTSMNLVAQLSCFVFQMRPEDAWTASTWNAACSLALQDEVGSLDLGKRADVLIHNVPDLAYWAYEPGRNTVEHVVLAGQVR
jgi:imidazolonepropionase